MSALIAYLVFTLLAGVIVCFFGKALYFPILMLGTFLSSLAGFIGQYGATWKGVLLGVIVGGLLALLVRFVYKAGVFLTGSIGGAVVGLLLAILLPESIRPFTWGIVAACALLFGICAVKWCDLFIMLGTALQGGSLVASALCFLLYEADNLSRFVSADGPYATITQVKHYWQTGLFDHNRGVLIGILAVCATAGFLVQRAQARRKEDRH